MTVREEFTGPTCPLCATNGEIERHAGHWLCFMCWTVFTGSQDEWNRMREQRENRARRYQREAAS